MLPLLRQAKSCVELVDRWSRVLRTLGLRRQAIPRRPIRFEDLPDEVLVHITNFAMHPDLVQAKLITLSRRLHALFAPLRFR